MRHFLPASHSLNDISSAHIFLSLLQNSFFFPQMISSAQSAFWLFFSSSEVIIFCMGICGLIWSIAESSSSQDSVCCSHSSVSCSLTQLKVRDGEQHLGCFGDGCSVPQVRFFLIPRLHQPERSWHPRTLWFTWATADSNYKVNMWVCVRVCAHPMQERLVWLHNQPPRGFTKSIKMGKGENCHVTQVCFWACKYTCIHSTTTATF